MARGIAALAAALACLAGPAWGQARHETAGDRQLREGRAFGDRMQIEREADRRAERREMNLDHRDWKGREQERRETAPWQPRDERRERR